MALGLSFIEPSRLVPTNRGRKAIRAQASTCRPRTTQPGSAPVGSPLWYVTAPDSGRVDPDSYSYIYLKCGAPQNNGHFCDKEVDQWLDDARKVTNLEERKAIQGHMRRSPRRIRRRARSSTSSIVS